MGEKFCIFALKCIYGVIFSFDKMTFKKRMHETANREVTLTKLGRAESD